MRKQNRKEDTQYNTTGYKTVLMMRLVQTQPPMRSSPLIATFTSSSSNVPPSLDFFFFLVFLFSPSLLRPLLDIHIGTAFFIKSGHMQPLSVRVPLAFRFRSFSVLLSLRHTTCVFIYSLSPFLLHPCLLFYLFLSLSAFFFPFPLFHTTPYHTSHQPFQ